MHSGVVINVCGCISLCTCRVAPGSPPPQQVEEDEDNVQVDGESSTDVFLRTQTIAHRPHQQLAVDHQELRGVDLGQEEKKKRWMSYLTFVTSEGITHT